MLPASIEAALWESRRDVWGSVPNLPSTATELLRCYFSTRTADLPAAPAPTVERLLGVILAAYGSAPGIDDTPYEVLRWDATFIAFLLGQALLAAHLGYDLEFVLGVNVDCCCGCPSPREQARPVA